MSFELPHPRPLLAGHLIARYDRFIAEVELDETARTSAGTSAEKRRIRAHCVNPGRMEGQVRSGARAWVSRVDASSQRKLRYTLELLDDDGVIVGANTTAPNRFVAELLAARVLPGLRRFQSLRAEVAYAERSRVDFVLSSSSSSSETLHYIEVKNAHLRYPDGRAYFPDTVSARATHHMHALAEVVARGAKATVLFVVQRPDVVAVRPSSLHDPEFAAAVREFARLPGARVRGLAVRASPTSYTLVGEIPVDLRPYSTDALTRWRAENQKWSGWQRSRSS